MIFKRLCVIASFGLATLVLLVKADSALAVATTPPLGTAQSFGVLAGSTVTSTGPSLVIGNLGLSPGSSVTGFPPGLVLPPATIHIDDAVAIQAKADATTAFNNLAGQACDFGPFGPTDLAGQTLVPGVYCYSSSVQNTGTVTLNGTATDVWVFKVGTTLTTGPGSSVLGTGSSCNVFWQVGSSATLNTTTTIEGTIIALLSISMENGAVLNGRALARNGAATLINNTVGASGCAGVPASVGAGVFKTFSPSSIGAGAVSTLTIVLTNANDVAAVLTAPFTDTLPAGVVIAATPNLTTTCGVGVPTAAPGGSSVTLPAGSTIPASSGATPGSCTLSVDVTAAAVACYLNTVLVGALQTSGGNNISPATASLCVGSAIAAAPTPTLSQWAITALLLLLALIGLGAMHRRNT